MKRNTFITPDFILETKYARKLYHEYAEEMPIIDYHCHLPPQDIAGNRSWQNMSQIWLSGDHYKWRAMRSDGVNERYCTGNASDWEKFQKWAGTMPHLLRNPLYHWSHLELARYFGITDRLLNPGTAKSIWNECNRKLAQKDFTCRRLLERMNVVLVCTTDDPTDTLEHHKAIEKDKSFKIKVLPAWRPDKGMAVDNPDAFNKWVDKLAEAADVDIGNIESFLNALRKRHKFFHDAGCRLSDHGLETIYAEDYTQKEIAAIFSKVRGGGKPDESDVLKFKSAMLYEFGVMDFEGNWTQQFHLGVIRNTNSRMFAKLGPDTGFDTIGDFKMARPMAKLLDSLEKAGKLTRTILYSINPCDNEMIATMLGNFQDDSVPGKMQIGSGWWFLDQKNGMEKQIDSLSNLGLLSRFVGMLTDSRSFLSYTRHEYFRRILCNILGNDMANGLIPGDMELVGQMVRDICYNNAASYFGFDVPKSGR
ncbi:MAG: glucuronate isomerase [Kiritimatiellae bacterium]|nr:glucuronate isomerase [Kiritimatiellia bacterium]MDD5523361.1 glucuronate isomerase [Kiritimatiellia bacterium]